MNSLPLVTIVTPTYNQADFLGRTIESVLSQDYPHLEYLVLDDGSTDNTEEVLKPYADRIRILKHPNMGQAKTLNAGWSMARGSILGYLSSDDLLYSGAVSAAVDCLQSNSDAILAFPDFHIIDPHDRILKTYHAGVFDYEHMISRMDCRIGPGAFFRQAVFQKAGGWDSSFRLIPDLEYWFRIGLLGRMVHIPAVHAGFRMHSGSTTFGNTRPEVSREYTRLADVFLSRNNLPPRIRELEPSIRASALISDCRTHLRAGRVLEAWAHLHQAWSMKGGQIPWATTTLMLVKALVGRSLHQARWVFSHFLHRK